MNMLNTLTIALGGAIGSVMRYWFSGLIARVWGETFPWGTIIVNITGCFVIGLFFTATGSEGRLLVPPIWRQFFMIGICGGYTTFSSFSLQTLNLANDGEWLRAGANVLLSVALCLVAVWVGHVLALQINSMKGS
jgi:CrcB protein